MILSVTWDVPENIEHFDLEKFIVSAFIKNLENDMWYYSSNGTDAHLGHHFVVPQKCELNITVTAINKCSREGSVSDLIKWIQGQESLYSKQIPSELITTNQVQHASNDPLISGKFVNVIIIIMICSSNDGS